MIDRWLFRPGGRYNAAVGRIAIAVSLLIILRHLVSAADWDTFLRQTDPLTWVPKGLVKLCGLFASGAPPAWFVSAAFYLAIASSVFMLVGLWVPLSQIIAVVSTTFLVSLDASFGPYWSHAFNVPLLAALAFMFCRSADVLSLDSAIRRRRGLPAIDRDGAYWWPVIFAELAIGLFLFGAFVQKVREGGLDWALSDNIRNALGVSWLQYRADPPALVTWLTSAPVRWQTAGALQLVTQASTVLAALAAPYPFVRLVGGAFFLIEILALGVVFQFWHWYWLPLCLFFVDVEYFWIRLFRLVPDARCTPRRAPSAAVRRLVAAFGCLFFGYYLLTIGFRWGEMHLNYPFSSMTMFAEVRAMKPYSQHAYWPEYVGRIDAYARADDPSPLPVLFRAPDLEGRVVQLGTAGEIDTLRNAYLARAAVPGLYLKPGAKWNGVPEKLVFRSGLMAITPYPQAFGLAELHVGLRAVRDAHTVRYAIGTLRWNDQTARQEITWNIAGFPAPELTMLARFNVREQPGPSEPVALPGEWRQNRFVVAGNRNDGRFIYSLLQITDRVLGVTETYYGPDNFQSAPLTPARITAWPATP